MENALLLPPLHTTFASGEKQTTTKPKPQSLVQQGAPRFYLSLIYAAFLQLCPLGGCDRAFAEPRGYFTCLNLSKTHLYAPG